MTNWEQPHWSGRPQPQAGARPRLKPNLFAILARFCIHNAGLVIIMTLFFASLSAGLAAFSIRILPDSQPLISLDEQTAKAQAQLDAKFPGIDKTFFAAVEGTDPAYARASALAVADELRKHDTLFKAVIVPGAGPFYDRFGLLFLPLDEINNRVARMLQMQPLYHALGQAPSIAGLAALIGEISRTVAEGRSPPGLDNVLRAMSEAVEGEVEKRPKPIDWSLLAGLKQQNQSLRWFIIAEPVVGQEAAAAAAARTAASRINGLSWSFPPGTFDGEPAELARDLAIPAVLSVFVVIVILMAGLGSVRQTIAVLAAAGAALAVSAGFAAGTRPVLDAVTWSLAAAVVTPALVLSLAVVIPYGEARARGKSAVTAVMLAAHRAGPRVLAFALIAEVLWLAWLPRQIDSLAVMAASVAVGVAAAALLSLTFVPAILAFGRHRDRQGVFHWLDDAVAPPATSNARNIRALFALVVMAASVFCTIFIPNVKFGDTQLRMPGGDAFTTPTAIGAVHFVVKPEEAPGLVEKVGKIPEAGALRWIEQFMPQDLAAKRNALRSLFELLPGVAAPVPPSQAAVTAELLTKLEADLRNIAGHPSADEPLRAAAHRLRRAMTLFLTAERRTLRDVAALEQSVFGTLRDLAAEADRLAVLPLPVIADLDDDLRRHFVSSEGLWRFEVLPKPGVTTLTFAAAMRRMSPEAAGVPIVALARNEIMHHEAILALAPALALAGLIALAVARRIDRMAVALVPTPMALALSAAGLVASGELMDAAMLGALSTTAAASLAASLTIAFGRGGVRGNGDWEMDTSFRRAILPLAAALAAVAPLVASGSPNISEFAYVASLFLIAAIICNALIAPQLAAWLRGALRPASGD